MTTSGSAQSVNTTILYIILIRRAVYYITCYTTVGFSEAFSRSQIDSTVSSTCTAVVVAFPPTRFVWGLVAYVIVVLHHGGCGQVVQLAGQSVSLDLGVALYDEVHGTAGDRRLSVMREQWVRRGHRCRGPRGRGSGRWRRSRGRQ